MNMISTGAFLNEMDASNKQPTVAEKFAAVWEKKNAKAARAGGVSLMALSLAACGGSSSTTTTTDTSTATTPATPANGGTFDLTPLDDIASGTMALNGSLTSSFRFTSGDEVINGITATMASTDVLIDGSADDNDVLNITATGTTQVTTVKIETVNVEAASGSVLIQGSTMTGVKNVNVSGTVAAEVDNIAQAATIKSDSYGRVINVDADAYAGTTADKNPDSVNLEVSGGTWGTTASTQTGFNMTADAGSSVIETLNVTSSGTAANTFNLALGGNVSLSTVNMLGSADATMRVESGDVTGLTIKGGDATGSVSLRIDTNSTSGTINAANFSGIDNFIMADSTVGSDNASMASLYSGAKLTMADDFNGENTVLTVKGATYSAPAASLTIALDNETANTDVDMQQINVQNVAALNIESNGFVSSSTADTAMNLIDDLVGDATTITITGDTSLNLDANIDAVQTATSATTARAVTVDASGMSSTAFLDFGAENNSKVSYTVTGTSNADTIVANNSGSTINGGDGKDTLTGGTGVDTIDGGAANDHIDISYGADVLTGGAGNDTYDVNLTATGAVAQITTSAAMDGGANGASAAGDVVSVTIDGATYATATAANSNLDTTIDSFLTAHKASILAAHGVTVAGLDVSGANTPVFDALKFTGKADGTAFTATVNYNDGGTQEAATMTTGTPGVAALDVDTDITDFAVGDIIDTVGLANLGTGGYYEGATSGMTAATEYGVVVLTSASYATSEAAEDAVAAATYSAGNAGNQTDNSTADVVIVYLNSTTGKAVATFDTDIDSDDTGSTNDLIVFENITTLTDLAATLSADSFVI